MVAIVICNFGPSRVRALPLGVRRQNVVATLNGVIFSLLLFTLSASVSQLNWVGNLTIIVPKKVQSDNFEYWYDGINKKCVGLQIDSDE